MTALHSGRSVLQMSLQIRLFFMRFGWSNATVCMLWLVGVLGWLALLPYLRVQEGAQQLALVRAGQALQAMNSVVPPAPPALAETQLASFYDALGEARYAEQQVKTLFAVAAKTGLTLTLADYKLTDDTEGRYRTYQIVLPVKGSYSAIRHFCEKTLLAMPFASLDEISFKRDAIASGVLEAKLSLTLFLKNRADAPQGEKL